MPRSARWGSKKQDRVLCVGDKPVTIWIVGEVDSAWFTLRSEPLATISVKAVPVVQRDLEAANHWLETLARGTNGSNAANPVEAGRNTAKKERGFERPVPRLFTAIYNAETCFGPKQSMSLLTGGDINKNDLVLLECKITRWPVGANGKTSYLPGWTKWCTGFELVKVCHLFQGPDDVASDPSIDDEHTTYI